jgi:hypothetical protein
MTRFSRMQTGAIGGGLFLAVMTVAGASSAGATTVPSLPSLPVSIAAPITALGNELAGSVLPPQGATSGSNATT